MPTPTLGYEEDTTITKSEVAKIQLSEAISHFLAGKYLCAITLSGAAEEIFARLLNARGERSVVEASFQAITDIREKTGLSAMGGKPKNEIFKEWNEARNTLKHHGKERDEVITINLFDEAYWMIKRALANAKKLQVPIGKELDFENWVVINVNS
ncbi:hypothetical protein LP417_11135 [Polaromonas sp. P1-6]|nr:hypothetical protein LP417_11135 [Polaromonas sp. P1-6]